MVPTISSRLKIKYKNKKDKKKEDFLILNLLIIFLVINMINMIIIIIIEIGVKSTITVERIIVVRKIPMYLLS